MTVRLVGCALVFLIAATAWADEYAERRLHNWHQWRGPLATGVAPHGDPPTEWSETKNIKWKVAIPGRGGSTPIVWEDRIFILTAIPTERRAESKPAAAADGRQSSVRPAAFQETEDRPREGRRSRGGNRWGITTPTNFHKFDVLCINRDTGETIWQRTAVEVVPHEGHHPTCSFAPQSPITDGRHVWAWFGSRGLHCYDLEGNLVWQDDYGDQKTDNSFGEGASVVLHNGTLVVPWDTQERSWVMAVDAATGDRRWKTDRNEETTWSTPLVVEWKGRAQVITNGSERVRSYDLETGELLWECGGLGNNAIATPVVIDGIAIAVTGHDDPAGIAVPLDAHGDVTGSDQIVWHNKKMTPYIASPIVYDDLLYMTKGRNAVISILEAKTGNVLVSQRRLPEQNTLYASLVGAAGRVYVPSREGTTVVLRHGREFEVLATNELDETIDASPAIVGREIFIRGDKHLYCITEE